MGVFIPVHIDRVKFFKKPGKKIWAYTKYLSGDDQFRYGEIMLFDEDGSPVVEFQGFKAQYLKGSRD